jgi:hypothetical protein
MQDLARDMDLLGQTHARGDRETGAGVEAVRKAQMDYATYTIAFTEKRPRRLPLCSYLLGYSRRQYVRFVARQDAQHQAGKIEADGAGTRFHNRPQVLTRSLGRIEDALIRLRVEHGQRNPPVQGHQRVGRGIVRLRPEVIRLSHIRPFHFLHARLLPGPFRLVTVPLLVPFSPRSVASKPSCSSAAMGEIGKQRAGQELV